MLASPTAQPQATVPIPTFACAGEREMRGDDSAVGGSLARAFFCALSGSGGDSAMRTVQYIPETGIVRLIDQTRLPAALEFVDCRTWQEVAAAIRSMRVRGAPALGVSGAYGLALAALRFEGDDPTEFEAEIGRAADGLAATRPTAVNLFWGLEQGRKVARRA